VRAWASLCFALVAFGSAPLYAASITSYPIKDGNATLITIEGELKFGDDKLFTEHALKANDALVILGSGGGSLVAGLEIGRAIRLKSFSTWVPDNVSCASACALAWLGGRSRLMASTARVGFHAAYRIQNGGMKEDGAANAIAGAYLNSLNLPQDFIIYATSAPPEGVRWLTFEDAAQYGLGVKRFDADKGIDPQGPQKAEEPTPAPNNAPALDVATQTPVQQPLPRRQAPEALSSPPLTTTVRPSVITFPLFDLTRLDVAVGVQRRLQQLNYFQTSVIDGVWGPRSRIALRDFKAVNGLQNTDEWDAATQAVLTGDAAVPAPHWYRAPEPLGPMEGLYRPFPPRSGATWHPLNPREAHIIQRRLQELGYYSLPPEGIWGLASRTALRDFKAAHGLAADDEWDAETQAALLRPDTIPAIATPFGQWATQGRSCSGPGAYKMVVSPNVIQVGPVECEVRQALARSGTEWSGEALCSVAGRAIPSRISLTVSGQSLIDRSIVGLPTAAAVLTRCPIE
jgi:peptidoglycan hydrolase-like protein with peptidoglycan-binding domain